MKKLNYVKLSLLLSVILFSCGGGSGEEGKKAAVVPVNTVNLKGNNKAVAYGGFPLVISVGQYTENFSAEDVVAKEGKKIVQLEIGVYNLGNVAANIPPASFTQVETSDQENPAIQL